MVGGALLWFYKSEKERVLRGLLPYPESSPVGGGRPGFLTRLVLAERQANVHGAGMPHIGGPFELLDGDGKTRTDKEFLGRYTLVYFGENDLNLWDLNLPTTCISMEPPDS